MMIRGIGARVLGCRFLPGAAWLGILAVLILLGATGIGLHHVHAQSTQQTADPQPGDTAADPQHATAAAENPEAPAQDPAAAAAMPPAAGQTKPEDQSPAQERKLEVANECSNLLKMATDLKAEVNKTTKDELSLAVVRKAGELEQFARKVRGDTRLTAGKD
ncbi:MAG TPA: hypothetical protein VGG26_01545 [Terracidiphilus sp.]|jgi:hypothetical protein